MKVYYAHPMSWYGTEREKADLACIDYNTPMGSEIVNPSEAEHVDVANDLKATGGDVMAYFTELVLGCDAVAYRTFDDGSIGSGVALEIFTAFIHGKQIMRLRDRTTDGKPLLIEEHHGLNASFGPRLLTIVQTRDYIKRGVK